MAHCFRLHFRVAERRRIGHDAQEWVLSDAPQRVVLKATRDDTLIRDANALVVRGGDYPQEEEALQEGDRWRSVIERAFARLGLAADFGDGQKRGGFTSVALAMLSQKGGVPILNDRLGLIVYECEPKPLFASMSATGVAITPPERVQTAVNYAWGLEATLSPEERLAFQLYSISFFETSADARLMLLMMAVEALLVLGERSASARAHVDTLIAATRASALPKGEIDSMIGSLRWLHRDSIGSAGRKLAGSLGGRQYMDEPPETFFDRCYAMRSRLVHGKHPRPAYNDVDIRAANLEIFVGHLICGPLLGGVPDIA